MRGVGGEGVEGRDGLGEREAGEVGRAPGLGVGHAVDQGAGGRVVEGVEDDGDRCLEGVSDVGEGEVGLVEVEEVVEVERRQRAGGSG